MFNCLATAQLLHMTQQQQLHQQTGTQKPTAAILYMNALTYLVVLPSTDAAQSHKWPQGW
jgi:hypothetical protein